MWDYETQRKRKRGWSPSEKALFIIVFIHFGRYPEHISFPNPLAISTASGVGKLTNPVLPPCHFSATTHPTLTPFYAKTISVSKNTSAKSLISFLLASNPKLILNFSGEQLQQYFPVCPFHWPDSIWTSWTSDSSVLKLRSENKNVGASFLEWWVCLLVFILSLSANMPLKIVHDTCYCQWPYVRWNPNISYVLSIWGNLKLILEEGV